MRTIGRLAILVLALVPMDGCGAHVMPPVDVTASAIKTSEHFQFAFDAKGVQIYRCQATPTGEGFEWHFIAPEAVLFDRQNQVVGKHYAGPTWEATDGSRIVAKLKAQAPAAEANAIPWLLLETVTSKGPGLLSGITTVQRINTVGGIAPTEMCQETLIGTERRVPYRATYYFYGSSAKN